MNKRTTNLHKSFDPTLRGLPLLARDRLDEIRRRRGGDDERTEGGGWGGEEEERGCEEEPSRWQRFLEGGAARSCRHGGGVSLWPCDNDLLSR